MPVKSVYVWYSSSLGMCSVQYAPHPGMDPDACAVLNDRRHFAKMVVRGVRELPSGKALFGEAPWRVRRVPSPCGHFAGQGLAPTAPGGGVTCPGHSGSGWNCQRPRPSPLTSSPSVAKAALPSLCLGGQVWGRCLRLSPSLSSWRFRSTLAAASLLQMHQGGSILTRCPVTCCLGEPAGKEFQTLVWVRCTLIAF